MMETTTAKKLSALLFILCLLLGLAGCGNDAASSAALSVPAPRQAVTEISRCAPSSISGLCSPDGTLLAVCTSDYEVETTQILLIDAEADTIRCETVLDGIWELKNQRFADGRLAIFSREENEWRFLNTSLETFGGFKAEAIDGFFSYDGSRYYYLRDGVLLCRDDGGTASAVDLPYELRFLELASFDGRHGLLAARFFLSRYGTDCGTAIIDTENCSLLMLQNELFQPTFQAGGLCLLQFDADAMGYSALYGSGNEFDFAGASVFRQGDLYAIDGAPYLINTSGGTSFLWKLTGGLASCSLEEAGICGEIYYSCWLENSSLLAGAIYRDGAFHFFLIDPEQLNFDAASGTASAESPIKVDESLAIACSAEASSFPLTATLQDTREYADEIESRYGVSILLSSQCRDAARLCDREITLTDSMQPADELSAISSALDAINRALSLYPDGFFDQFKNSAGDGGIVFLLVGGIDSSYGVVGCAYENFLWQYIALDIRASASMDSLVCHELWHSTENRILSTDYAAILPDTWAALNPAGFEYCGYETPSSEPERWTLFGDPAEEVYFVDAYSKTDAREDRARIMEYFMVHDDEARLLIESPVIRQKLQIMCDAVRRTFDTGEWKIPRWEALLN